MDKPLVVPIAARGQQHVAVGHGRHIVDSSVDRSARCRHGRTFITASLLGQWLASFYDEETEIGHTRTAIAQEGAEQNRRREVSREEEVRTADAGRSTRAAENAQQRSESRTGESRLSGSTIQGIVRHYRSEARAAQVRSLMFIWSLLCPLIDFLVVYLLNKYLHFVSLCANGERKKRRKKEQEVMLAEPYTVVLNVHVALLSPIGVS